MYQVSSEILPSRLDGAVVTDQYGSARNLDSRPPGLVGDRKGGQTGTQYPRPFYELPSRKEARTA